MSVARSGAARPGATVTARSLMPLFAAALATLCLAFALALAPAQAEAAQGRGAVCVGPRVSAAPTPRMATASALGFVGVAEWLGARAGTALAEKGFLTGLEAIMRAAGHRNA